MSNPFLLDLPSEVVQAIVALLDLKSFLNISLTSKAYLGLPLKNNLVIQFRGPKPKSSSRVDRFLRTLSRNRDRFSDVISCSVVQVPKEAEFSLKELSNLAVLTNLRSLSITEVSKVSDFSFMKNFTNLNELVLTNCGLKNGLDLLHLTTLKSFSINSCLKFTDLSFLRNFQNLKSLNFDNVTLYDSSLDFVCEHLRSIENLFLWNIRHLIGDGLFALTKLQNLHSLSIFFPTPSRYNFNPRHFVSLTTLTWLKFCQYRHPLSQISTLTNLEFLECNTCSITGDSTNTWNFPKLKTLIAKRNPNFSGNSLASLVNLEMLDIEDYTGQFSFLSSLRQLITLGINRTLIGGDLTELEHLGALPKLEYLYMNFCPNLHVVHPLTRLTSLTHLQLRGNSIESSEIISLSKLTSLVNLQLTGISILPDDLEKFTSLKLLQRLDFGDDSKSRDRQQ